MASSSLHAQLCDITQLSVDAIVNAANATLAPGAGVDGAIREAAGAELTRATAVLGGCETGEAKLTPGFLLPARWIIHTVGPIWRGGGEGEAEALKSCYRRCLEIAASVSVKSLAFPMISTGIYGFPKELASEIAVKSISEVFESLPSTSAIQVTLTAFTNSDLDILSNAIRVQNK